MKLLFQIIQVQKNSPANGKLAVGDEIISINNYSIADLSLDYCIKTSISTSPLLKLPLKSEGFLDN